MAKEKERPKRRAAISPEARENQLIALATDRAEEMLLNGTASSQVIVHFLKLGTTKYQREKEKLEEENKLLRAKTKQIEEQKEIAEMYKEALAAMSLYSGNGGNANEDFE